MGADVTFNANRALWEKGDFTKLAATMRESGEELVAGLGIAPGMRVLDLGCGDGTTALPAARMGADVLGVDIAANLVTAGNTRAAQAGLTNLRFEQGDASRLTNVGDGSFDLLISIFGAMFAPRPADVAREMVRVVRPGGRIVMGNWIPGDPTLVAEILRVSSTYTPPPPTGFISPVTWGNEAIVRKRFSDAGIPDEHITCERSTYRFRHPMSAKEFLATFRNYYGPTMTAFEAAAAAGSQEALLSELEQLFEKQNQGGQHSDFPATFLKVTVTKPY